MQLAFVHDDPLIRTPEGKYFSETLTYPVWQRYLRVFDGITILSRVREEAPSSRLESSGPCVEFRPIRAYRHPADLLRRFKHVRKDISDGLNSSDCVIVRLPSVLGVLACLEARKRGMPVLIEMVGCAWDAYWHHGVRGKCLAPVAFVLTRRLVRSSPFVIYVTSAFLQRRYPSRGSSESISNVSVDVDEGVLQRRLAKPAKADGIVTLGSMGKIDLKYKGHHLVIKALGVLSASRINVRYEIVGAGEQKNLLRLARRVGLSDRVFALGRKSPDQVRDWLDSIDIYVQPSLTEGLPRALIEAMSRGLPVVGSTAGGIPELLDPETSFSKGNVASLASTMQTMLMSDWSGHARRNHGVSREYSKDLLQNRRDNFLIKFRDWALENTAPAAAG